MPLADEVARLEARNAELERDNENLRTQAPHLPAAPQTYDLREWCKSRGYRFVKVFLRYGFREPIPDYDPKKHGSDPDRYMITAENAAKFDEEMADRRRRWEEDRNR